MSSTGQKIGSILIVLVLLLAVVGFIYGSAGLGEQRTESKYTGHVVDVVEERGFVFTPTWVNMKTDKRSSDIQSYCIAPEDKSELLPKFYEAMESGDRYTVTYERPRWVNPNDCRNSDAIITGIRPVNSTA